jgi:hypothetical protein
MRTRIASILSVFMLAAATAALLPEETGAAEASLEIRIFEEATVRGDTVTLGQIASFHPARDPRVASLEGVEVASAPAPGNTQRFNRRFLNYKVGSAIADEGEEVRLKAPDNLMVHRTAQVVTSV